MKILNLFCLIMLFVLFTNQNINCEIDKNFLSDLDIIINNKSLKDNEINEFIMKYQIYLFPHSDTNNQYYNMIGVKLKQFPLEELKRQNIYKKIENLIDSKNENNRILFYILVAAANDSSFNDKILEKIKFETRNENIIWGIMALLYLKDNHVDDLFDLMIKYENFVDSHMLPFFFQLDKKLLYETAKKNINKYDDKSKILSCAIIGVMGYTEESEKLLKKCLMELPTNLKGYAIAPLISINSGNLLEILKPLLNIKETKSIALQALINSPTKEDNDYFKSLIPEKDEISIDFLVALEKTNKKEILKFWLKLIQRQNVPDAHFFFFDEQSLIYSSELEDDVLNAITNIKKPKILSELVRILKGKKDERSTKLLLTLLRNGDSSVRYWTADALKGNTNNEVIDETKKLIKDKNLRTVALVDILIDNNINDQQNIFDDILKTEKSNDWKNSSYKYLSTFPLDYHKELFKKAIYNQNESYFIKRYACEGLGNLKDESEIQQIVKLMNEELKGSVYNIRTYLFVLNKIHTELAKSQIMIFKDEKEENIRKIVNEILDKW